MFGRVYSKPRKGGGFYSPMRYYYCKNRFTTSGKKCSYVHQVRQEVLDAQVRQVIQEALRNRDFTDRIIASLGTTDNLDAMNAELDALQAARKKELRQKTKLLGKIAEPLRQDRAGLHGDLQRGQGEPYGGAGSQGHERIS